MVQAANYAAAYHWMRAADSGTLDGVVVAKKMQELPVNDFYHDNVPIARNGQLLETMHIWRVKPLGQAKGKFDSYEPLGSIPGNEAFVPLAETGCGLAGP